MTMTNQDELQTLTRTLCHTPHRAVLLKNAFQFHSDLAGRRTNGSTVTDRTLFSVCEPRTRVDVLQPPNDPFILDNIFKSQKSKRRGLLSWNPMPSTDTSGHMERPGGLAPMWDFSRQIRARNRRRSILGNKVSFTSMRRRRQKSDASNCSGGSVVGDHTRSISDPARVSLVVSPAVLETPSALRSSFSVSSTSLNDGSTTEEDYDGSSGASSPRSLPSSTATISGPPHLTPPPATAYRRLEPFPKLRHNSNIMDFDFRLSDMFSNEALFNEDKGRFSLGIALSHTATIPSRPTKSPYTPACIHPVASGHVEVQRPEPVFLRTIDSRLRSQRCFSMPCAPPKPGFLLSKRKTASQLIIGHRLDATPVFMMQVTSCGMTSPPTKTRNAELSKIEGPGQLPLPSTASLTNTASVSASNPDISGSCINSSGNSSTATAARGSNGGWFIPASIRLLRKLAACGPMRRKRPLVTG
ncbi:hypothetical protein BX661DRAFT_174933, partial [Kickxella alabastrina]|uniref:uncharacterized protein n=1 Tax=Kickxella alabastrina TaxID=61397 RepID=UPI00221F1580